MTPYIHTYHVNVRDGADIRRERHPLASGDKNADTFVVYLRDHDSIVNLSGAGVSGKVIRPDGQTVPLTGKVVDGAAQVTLDEACYEVPGEIKLTVTVSAGDMTQSVLIVMMDVQTCETSVIVDNGVIGTLADLLAEIANMRAATSAANAAADRANQAADFYDSGIRAAMLNGVITDGIVPYWGRSAEMEIGRDNYPAEQISVVRHGGTAVLNGTATASVRVTMSGDLARTATNADFSALARTVDLVYGREYELEIRLISGSITGTDLRCIVYEAGTTAVAAAVLDSAVTGRGITRFTWENGVTDAIIALRIPTGMSFTNCEVCCVLTDVAAREAATADATARAGVAENAQAIKDLETAHNDDYAYAINLIAAAGAQSVKEASKKVAALSDDLTPMLEAVDPIARDSDCHFYPLIWTNTTEITTYAETDGVISEHTSKPLGSGIMPCPRNLFFEFADSSSRLWLYFYDLSADGTYTPNWDVLNLTTSTKLKNYLNPEYGRKAIRDIPDGLYIQFAVAVGDVKVYGWDGESFGPPITSNTSIVTTSGNTNNYMADGNGSVVIPGDARYLVVTDNRAKLRAGIAVKDGVSAYLGSADTEFVVLPGGYDYFMYRLDPNVGEATSFAGDASKYVSAVCRMQKNRQTEAAAKYVIDAARKICEFSWVPAAQIRVQGGGKPFYPGVRYNGIPYGSGWQVAHFVGWHVSPHTYINAVADDASIMVAEGLGDGGEAPYYSTVCSAFAVMAAGWPHPVLNDGMAVNPRVKLVRSVVPPIGAVWSNVGKSGGKHCVIPERIDYIGENVRSYSSYEGLPATSMRTTRYSNVTNAGDKTGFKLAAGASYFDAYGAAAYHVDAVRDMSNIPYWDADAAVVTGGAARPYRGDKSVYTSTMESVLINIKDPDATLLLLRIPEGGTYSIDINGETQIDVKKYTISDGIYYVYTNTSVVEESFEYVNVVPYNCTITNGQAVFDRNDFWYAYTKFRTNPGNAYYPHTKDIYVNIPSNSGGDYSDWASVGRCYDVVTVFCKGQYGAYTVPCNTTVINNVPESGGSISLDTTLTQPGMAADAAAVGEAVNGLAEEIEALKESGGSGGGTGGIVTETDPTVPAWAKQPNPPTYTAEQVGALPNTYVPPNQTAEQVGADPTGTAVAAVGEHNTDEDAHNDIRLLLADLDKRLGTLADSDDTTLDQLSEIVAYIKSNKSLIDGITTGKISTADIVDNLTTNAANKPLSAAQGVALKKLIDAIVVPTKLSELSDDATHRLTTDTEKAAWNAKSTFSGKYEDLTGKPTIPTVPTNVSAFENDAGYAKQEDVTELSEEITARHVPFVSRKIVAIGDSITQGTGDGAGGFLAALKSKYPTITTVNLGVGSTTFAVNDSVPANASSGCIFERIDDIPADADYIILQGGLNDFFHRDTYGVQYGEYVANLHKYPFNAYYDGSYHQLYYGAEYGGTLSQVFYQETFCGAFEMSLVKIMTRFYDKKYVLLIPHDPTGSAELAKYLDAEARICKKYGFPCIDLRLSAGMPRIKAIAGGNDGTSAFTVDEVHPNMAGYTTQYLPAIERWLVDGSVENSIGAVTLEQVLANTTISPDKVDIVVTGADGKKYTYSVYGALTAVEEGGETTGYTNLVPTSVDTDGSIYNGTGYKDDTRFSTTSGTTKDLENGCVTGFIAVDGSIVNTVRIAGYPWITSIDYNMVCAYTADKTFLGAVTAKNGGTSTTGTVIFDTLSGTDEVAVVALKSGINIGFIRVGYYDAANADVTGANLIVTVNEEITL